MEIHNIFLFYYYFCSLRLKDLSVILNIIPDTIYIRFKHLEINSRLTKFAKAKILQENLIASKDTFPSKEAFNKELEQMNETCEQMKQHLVDTNRVVKKGTSGISVRIYPENTYERV